MGLITPKPGYEEGEIILRVRTEARWTQRGNAYMEVMHTNARLWFKIETSRTTELGAYIFMKKRKKWEGTAHEK